jgi:UDP-glucose 4-epimerase
VSYSTSRRMSPLRLCKRIASMPNLNRWRGQRILVTGGSGFLGSHLCQRFARAGGGGYTRLHALSGRSEPGGPIWWQVDLTAIDRVRKLLTDLKPMVVYHLAGSAGAKPDLDLVLPTLEGLVVSAVNILVAGNRGWLWAVL